MSACYNQFEKLINLGKHNHQIIVSTHWYGYLPIVTNGSATSIKKNTKNDITIDYFNLYNYRETITQSRKQIKGILPIDYSIKSYNDLVQSIVFSIIQEVPYNWIICEGLSEKIYFEEIFKNEILNNNLRILPLGSYKEVKKVLKRCLKMEGVHNSFFEVILVDNNTIQKINKEGINALVITDAEDRCSVFSDKAFFIGIKGANFGHFNNDVIEKYSENNQVVVFDGTRIYNVDRHGRTID